MPTILQNALGQLASPLGFWLGAVLPVGLVLLGVLALLGLQGLLFAFRIHMDSLHDLLRTGRRMLFGAMFLVFALWCLCTAWIAAWHAPYGYWLAHAPAASLVPVGFHAGGVALWVLMAVLLARRAAQIFRGPQRAATATD